jgi:serine/threonine protein phosphatase PrpC
VIAVPAFTTFEVTKEDFLILSCDGLYEAMQKERAFKRKSLVEWIAKRLPTTHNPAVICGSVLNECLLRGKLCGNFVTLSGSNDNMSAIIVEFKDGSDHSHSVKFLPGPHKIPKQLKPTAEAQRVFQCAYMENARDAGYSVAEARAIRKKLSPTNKLRL